MKRALAERAKQQNDSKAGGGINGVFGGHPVQQYRTVKTPPAPSIVDQPHHDQHDEEERSPPRLPLHQQSESTHRHQQQTMGVVSPSLASTPMAMEASSAIVRTTPPNLPPAPSSISLRIPPKKIARLDSNASRLRSLERNAIDARSGPPQPPDSDVEGNQAEKRSREAAVSSSPSSPSPPSPLSSHSPPPTSGRTTAPEGAGGGTHGGEESSSAAPGSPQLNVPDSAHDGEHKRLASREHLESPTSTAEQNSRSENMRDGVGRRSSSRPVPQSTQSKKRQRSSSTPPSSPLVKNTNGMSGMGKTAKAHLSGRGRRPEKARKAEEEEKNCDEEEEEEDDDEGDVARSSFYLRHQNRALASELKSFKRQLKLLTQERDYRRTQCHKALASVQRVHSLWTEMEAALTLSLKRHVSHKNGDETAPPQQREDSCDSDASDSHRVSTGEGSDVEFVGSLIESLKQLGDDCSSLVALGEKDVEDGSGDDDGLHDSDDSESDRDKPRDLPKSSGKSLILRKTEEDHELDERSSRRAEKGVRTLEAAISSVQDRLASFREIVLQLVRQSLRDGKELATESDDGKRKKRQRGSWTNDDDSGRPILNVSVLRGEIALLKRKCEDYEGQIKELSLSRDGALMSEKKIRRGLYRVSTGRSKIGEVVKAVERDGKSLTDEADLNYTAEACADAGDLPSTRSVLERGKENDPGRPEIKDNTVADSAEINALKSRIAELEEVASSRDKRIHELLGVQEAHEKRVTELVASTLKKAETSKPPSPEDVKASPVFAETAAKLSATLGQMTVLKAKVKQLEERWAQALADAEHGRKTIRDFEEKHARKWKELEEQGLVPCLPGTETENVLKGGDNHGVEGMLNSLVAGAERSAELEHKLAQALESARQAENLRKSVAEMTRMNETLQTKLDELKVKNAALVAGKSAARASSIGESTSGSSGAGANSSLASPSSTHRSSSSAEPSSSSSSTHDKFRRMKKELAAAVNSKESAKAKQERAEKERDGLMKTNSRLVKQSAEKDDINAKSLSTILHLKKVTDELKQENEIMERKTKGAEQLALAARLAANAKERADEEAVKEKEVFASEVQQWQDRASAMREAKEQADVRCTESKAETESVRRDLDAVRKRCDELASQSKKCEDEKQRIAEALAVAKRKATAAAEKVAEVTALQRPRAGGKGAASGEVDKLTTQVDYLKTRVTCPVCNHRDKQCILMRCRHMFCKPCVETNIKNRSRKCPACGQRFDTKDVADVWL